MSAAKRAAAAKAVTFVQDGMRVGLGTGSTSEEMVKLLIEKKLRIQAAATSEKIARMAREGGIEVTPDFEELDITLDGADEADPQGRLIKGGGGALLREKLVAQASRKLVIMVDPSKHVPRLGTGWALPVEVIPFGWKSIRSRVERLGCEARIREGFITDSGNWIADCSFGPIDDPEALHAKLKSLCGVVETGLFLGMCDVLVTGNEDGLAEVQSFSRP